MPGTLLILSRSDRTLSTDGRLFFFSSEASSSLSSGRTKRLPPITFICSTGCPVTVDIKSASDCAPSSPPIVADVHANLTCSGVLSNASNMRFI